MILFLRVRCEWPGLRCGQLSTPSLHRERVRSDPQVRHQPASESPAATLTAQHSTAQHTAATAASGSPVGGESIGQLVDDDSHPAADAQHCSHHGHATQLDPHATAPHPAGTLVWPCHSVHRPAALPVSTQA